MAATRVCAILQVNDFVFKERFLTRLKGFAKLFKIDVLVEVLEGNATSFCFRTAEGLPRHRQNNLDNLIDSFRDDILKHVRRYRKQRMNSLNLQTPA